MKKTIFTKLALLLVAVLTSVKASAYDFTVDGLYYNIVSFPDLTCAVTSNDTKYSGDIVIPEQVTYNGRTLTVTSIGWSAFEGCTGLTSISSPNSVTSIGGSAFEGCSGLTSVSIPNSVTSIGNSAFSGCSSLTSVSIPNSVTSIRYSAFSGCYNLTSVSIGNSVTSIGDYAFQDCTSLTSVTIPNSVTEIGQSAFRECSGLTSITIPNSVTSILDYAFSGCTSLKKLRIEDGTETLSLGVNAFTSDYKKEVTQGLFYDCPLETLYLGRDLEYDVTPYSISSLPFCGKKSITELSIGSTVTSLITMHQLTSAVYSTNLIEGCSKIMTIYSYATTPPRTDGFTNQQYLDAKVYVPQGSLAAYQAADVWENFWGLQEFDPTGISGVEAATGLDVSVSDGCIVVDNATGHVTVYDISGVAVASGNADGGSVSIAVPGHGVYIVRVGSKAVKVCL